MNDNLKVGLLLVVLVAVLAVPVRADASGGPADVEVCGQVKDCEEGLELQGATIAAWVGDGEPVSTLSDNRGFFCLNVPGSFLLGPDVEIKVSAPRHYDWEGGFSPASLARLAGNLIVGLHWTGEYDIQPEPITLRGYVDDGDVWRGLSHAKDGALVTVHLAHYDVVLPDLVAYPDADGYYELTIPPYYLHVAEGDEHFYITGSATGLQSHTMRFGEEKLREIGDLTFTLNRIP